MELLKLKLELMLLMHSLVASLQTITEHMVQQLDSVSEEQILFFIDQREQIVEQLKQLDITEADQQQYGSIVRGVLQYDPLITTKLEELRTAAVDGFQKIGVAKVQHTAYSTPYIPDSYYFDKKK